jgi:peptidoglycan/LPS O-acetylase OafA/YrhL
MVAPTAPPSRAQIIPCLSGLRGVAALAVVYLHQNSFDHGQRSMGGWDTWHEFGHIAVIFFFVLSAFLLTYRGLYDVKRESDVKYITVANRRVPILSLRWISYFIRRLFRIYPCYMLTVILAACLPRFQGDEIMGPNSPYYFDFGTNKPIPPSDLVNYFFLYDVKSLFWTIPPEIEYYFVIPFIVVLFEAAQHLDETLFVSKQSHDEEEQGQTSLSGQVAMALVNNIRRCLFRTLHVVFFSFLAVEGILDSRYWQEKKTNEHHLPRHYFRFWTGSFIAIMLYLFERNGLVPQLPKSEDIQGMVDRAVIWMKKALFLACDLGCWGILVATILSFPWYQGNYFGVKIEKVNPKEWPPSWAINDTHVFYHSNAFKDGWYDTHYSSTRFCAYMCGLLVFLICFGARNGSFSNFFLWRFFTWAGEVSFPIYLTHFIALREYPRLWLKYVSPVRPILIDNVILGMLMSVLIASIMHWAVEKPCMRAGSWLVRYLRRTVFKPKESPNSLEVKC